MNLLASTWNVLVLQAVISTQGLMYKMKRNCYPDLLVNAQLHPILCRTLQGERLLIREVAQHCHSIVMC